MHYPKIDICPRSGQSARDRLVCFTVGLSFLSLSSPSPVIAQITPDSTLGAEQSIVTPGVNINGLPAELIEGGAVRGVNLFHSFTDFNVGNAQRVYFADPGSISRIVGRVTGNNASFIDGTLGVAGNADLYLINPNGILFGPNARLDINGSFLASTANGLTWGNGLEFNTTNPQAPPLLTIDLPVSLTFAPSNTSLLSSEGQLTTGADLTLAAERLELQGAVEAGGDLNLLTNQEVQIRDSASQPFNATAQGDLLIQGDQGVDIFTLNYPDSWLVAGGNLTLRSDGGIIGDTRFWSGGDFTIETLAGQTANLLSPNDPIILAAGDVTLGDYIGASLHILASGSVTLGDIIIDDVGTVANTINPNHLLLFIKNLSDVTLSDGTSVTVDGTITTLDVRAGIDWSQLPGFPGNLEIGIGLPTITPAAGANITTGDIGFGQLVGLGRVILSNQYFPNNTSGSIATGAINANTLIGGDVILDSRNTIAIGSNNLNGTDVSINASACDWSLCVNPIFPTGFYLDGGNVRLLANTSLSLDGDILANGRHGGNINLQTGSDFNLIENLSVLSYTTTLPGQGGDIAISVTGDFSLGNRAAITNATEALARAGDININATGDITLTDGSKVQSFSTGTGRAGDVFLSANNIRLIDSIPSTINDPGASTSVISKALAQGDAGNVTLTAINQVLLDEGYIFASTGDLTNVPQNAVVSTGDAGTVTVNANRLTLNTDPNSTVTPSFIAVDSQGAGRAGSIVVNTPNGVTELIGTNANGLPSAFVFNGFDQGLPGSLDVRTRELLVQDGALISGNAGERVFGNLSTQINAGRIDIDASQRIQVIDSGPRLPSSLVLETEASGPSGGTFTLNTQQFLVENGGNVSAQTIGAANAGALQVNANEVRISGESNGFRSRLFFESQNSGQAGGVDINANQVVVDDRGLISVSSTGTGNAGNLSITGNRITVASGGEVLAQSTGADAGDIAIASNYLTMLDGGTISASSIGANGGNVTFSNQRSIELGDRTNIDNRALNRGGNQILATVQGNSTLNGGVITFNNVRQIDMLCCDNTIAAAAELDANGGNIFFNFPAQLAPLIGGGRIDSPGDLTVNNDVLATAEFGNGGFVQLNNFSFLNPWGVSGDPLSPLTSDIPINFVDFNRPTSTPLSEFTARSISGNDGTVEINLIESLEPDDLPSEFLGNDLEQSCTTGGRVASEQERSRSTFTLTGQGGLAPSPDAPLGGDTIRVPLAHWPAPTAEAPPALETLPISQLPPSLVTTSCARD